jgi:hypothetical protein
MEHKRIFDAVADSWRDLQQERDWAWMRATLDVALTPDVSTYTGTGLGATRFKCWRPQDDTYCMYLYQSGSPNSIWTVDQMQLDRFRHEYVYRTWGSTTPNAWAEDETKQLLIGPAPNLAYMLRAEYWKGPQELADDAHIPELPERFHVLLVWLALQQAAFIDAAPEVKARADTNARTMKSQLMRDQARRPHL